MKQLVVIIVLSLSLPCLAWTDVKAFEAEASGALSSSAALTNTAFVCSLTNACQVADDPSLRDKLVASEKRSIVPRPFISAFRRQMIYGELWSGMLMNRNERVSSVCQ